MVYKLVAKLIYLVAKPCCHISAHLPPMLAVVRLKTKHTSIWSKALIMPSTICNCVKSYKQKYCFKWNLFLHAPYRVFRQQLFFNGWQMGFSVKFAACYCYFEPCMY